MDWYKKPDQNGRKRAEKQENTMHSSVLIALGPFKRRRIRFIVINARLGVPSISYLPSLLSMQDLVPFSCLLSSAASALIAVSYSTIRMKSVVLVGYGDSAS